MYPKEGDHQKKILYKNDLSVQDSLVPPRMLYKLSQHDVMWAVGKMSRVYFGAFGALFRTGLWVSVHLKFGVCGDLLTQSFSDT